MSQGVKRGGLTHVARWVSSGEGVGCGDDCKHAEMVTVYLVLQLVRAMKKKQRTDQAAETSCKTVRRALHSKCCCMSCVTVIVLLSSSQAHDRVYCMWFKTPSECFVVGWMLCHQTSHNVTCSVQCTDSLLPPLCLPPSPPPPFPPAHHTKCGNRSNTCSHSVISPPARPPPPPFPHKLEHQMDYSMISSATHVSDACSPLSLMLSPAQELPSACRQEDHISIC